MPSHNETAYAAVIQAAYSIGIRDGLNLVMDRLPPHLREPLAQQMLADRAQEASHMSSETLDEIANLQVEILRAHAGGN